MMISKHIFFIHKFCAIGTIIGLIITQSRVQQEDDLKSYLL